VKPFILKWELIKHPEKAFVEQLIHELLHGCSIGYFGPHFAHLANSLVSSCRIPDVIEVSFHQECEVGRILGPFPSPPVPPQTYRKLEDYLSPFYTCTTQY